MGFTCLFTQVVLTRELLIAFLGNEISIGIIFACWLLLIALGSGGIGKLADRLRLGFGALAMTQLLLAILLPLEILFARSARGGFLLPGQVVPPHQMLISSFLVLMPVCLISGFQFALGCRLAAHGEKGETGAVHGAAWVYWLEAIGNILAGLTFHYYVADHLQSLRTMVLLSLVNSVSAGWLILAHCRGRRSLAPLTAIAGIWVVATSFYGWRSEPINLLDRSWYQRQWPGLRIVAAANSRYGNLAVSEREGQVSFFQDGALMSTTEDEQTNEELVHIPLLEHRYPRRVLLLGGGVTGALDEILKHPVDRVDYIELDPTVIDLARQWLPERLKTALSSPRVRVHYLDGRLFVKETEERFDVVIVNLPDPSTALLNRFYTREFFQEVARILKPGGIISLSLSSSPTFLGEDLRMLTASVYRALISVFPDTMVVPGETAYFVASDQEGGLTYDYRVLAHRLRDRGVSTWFLTEFQLSEKLLPFRVDMLLSAIGEAGPVEANRDFRPITYYYDTTLWVRQFSPWLARIFSYLLQMAVWWFALPAGIALAAALVTRGRSARYRGISLVIGVMAIGLAGMAVELVTIFAFQVIRGYVYHQIGILITTFMAGLAAGAWLASWWLKRGKGDVLLGFTEIQGAACLLMVVLPIVLQAASAKPGLAPAILGGVMILSGLLVGFAFPLATQISLASGGRAANAAGAVYAADLIGAFLGAALVSALIVPILGIADTCFAVAWLGAAAFILLIGSVIGQRSGITSSPVGSSG